MQCTLSPLAEEDLEDIGDYIARDNPTRAISFVRDIRERCAKIAAVPMAAPLCPELAEDVRMIIFGQYLIFYTVEAEEIRVERILHGARNIRYLFDA